MSKHLHIDNGKEENMISEKKDKSMTFRLSSEDYGWLEKAAYNMGTTPSKLVRQMIQMSINATKAATSKAAEILQQNQLKES